MARLLGFQKTKSDTGDNTVRLLEKTYLNRTKYGEFNTVEEVDGFIGTLKGLPQSNTVQEKIADMENKKLQISTRLGDILSDKNVFDTDLQDALAGSAKNNFKNMKGLIGSYAAILGDAAERYDQEVVSNVMERYGTTSNIPAETLQYRKELNDRAKLYASLFNSYNVQDPSTGEIGMLNPDNFAVIVDTNPVNGSIQRLDIVPSGSVDKGYMRTEVGVNVIPNLPNKKLTVFLRTNDTGVTEDGKSIKGAQLGNISYQGTVDSTDDESLSKGILKAEKQKVGFLNWANIFSDSREEKLNASIEQVRESGINFDSGAYQFDANNVPNDSVLKMGSRVFYSTGKDNEVLEISGKSAQEKQTNLDNYLKSVGKDSSKMLPYYVTKDYLYADDGSYKVKGKVDENYFTPPQISEQSNQFNNVPQRSQVDIAAQQPTEQPAEQSFFAGRTNRPNKPEEPTESAGGAFSVKDVVEKGKSFFRQDKASFFNK